MIWKRLSVLWPPDRALPRSNAIEAQTDLLQPPFLFFCSRCTASHGGGMPGSEKLSPQLRISANNHHDVHRSDYDMDLYWLSNSRCPEASLNVGSLVYWCHISGIFCCYCGIGDRYNDITYCSSIVSSSVRLTKLLVGLCALNALFSRVVPAHCATAFSWSRTHLDPTSTESTPANRATAFR